jgi:peptidoglycan/xylan/chitin deacetylase (PgdA/CDA1 family)
MSKISLPEGARMAVTVQFLTEWWGDHGKLPGSEYPNQCLGSTREYGARTGYKHVLRALKKNNVKSSAMFSGLLAEKFPEVVREIANDGHEIVGHGYDQAKAMYMLSKEEERAAVKNCKRLLEEASGRKVLGWSSSQRSCTPYTMEILMDEGFVWNGDLGDTDMPYPIKANGKTIIMVPHGVVCTDMEEFILFDREGHRQTLRGCKEALDFMVAQFDAVYSQSTPEAPLKMSLGWHSFLAGKPDYTWALDQFIQHVKSHKQAIFVTNLEIAQWWLKHCM